IPPVLIATETYHNHSLASNLEEYIDKGKISTIQEIESLNFSRAKNSNLVYQKGEKSVWLKFKVLNKSHSSQLFINIPYTDITRISLYKNQNGHIVLLDEVGYSLSVKKNISRSPDFILK